MKIDLGWAAKPLPEQLADHGYEFIKPEYTKRWEKAIDGFRVMCVFGVITDAEKKKIAQRMINRIGKDIKRMEGEE